MEHFYYDKTPSLVVLSIISFPIGPSSLISTDRIMMSEKSGLTAMPDPLFPKLISGLSEIWEAVLSKYEASSV